jgi:hypothetical protein
MFGRSHTAAATGEDTAWTPQTETIRAFVQRIGDALTSTANVLTAKHGRTVSLSDFKPTDALAFAAPPAFTALTMSAIDASQASPALKLSFT